ncbi:uncharacterized protein TrAtP1_009279 [Trichoderma atroviride]|uniref:uncharacterized protein n=1 Tax=Hypocrea atroviridis TaxID=63577 RepID=UPI0033183D8C|nr:hypothetical protein TrAtP1_009279 [Trichoderma atroviride]
MRRGYSTMASGRAFYISRSFNAKAGNRHVYPSSLHHLQARMVPGSTDYILRNGRSLSNSNASMSFAKLNSWFYFLFQQLTSVQSGSMPPPPLQAKTTEG